MPRMTYTKVSKGTVTRDGTVDLTQHYKDISYNRMVDMINQLQDAQDAANAANEKRYQEGLDIYDQILGQYQPGGTYGQGMMDTFDTSMRQAKAATYQNLVNSGMANITGSYDIVAGKKRASYAKQVEDDRITRLDEGLRNKAGFIERREDVAPSMSLYAQLAQQLGQAY